MDNSALPPCRTQGDNETVCFVVKMIDQKLDYGPTWKMGHYRWFRIRWCAFTSQEPTAHVLFLYCNSMGTGKTNKQWAGNYGALGDYDEYSFSMPIEHNTKIAYNTESDKWRWMPMPDSANLRNMTFYAYPDGKHAGGAPSNFVTEDNPVFFEIEMRCSL